MGYACHLCCSGRHREAGLLDDEGEPRSVCEACGGKIARLVLQEPRGLVEALFLLPPAEDETLEEGRDGVRLLYRNLGLLDDALYEAATAYVEFNDEELRRDALTVLLGLRRDDDVTNLRRRLFPV
ncbi:MAG: hypothetical protein ACO32I_08865 [Candidatus Limnocylindrus sp.]